MDIIRLSSVSAEKGYEEELTIIQTNILLNGSQKKVISLVPVAKEKEAFPLAVSLAEVFAKGHRNVLLIDISREGEKLLKMPDDQESLGLFDVLEDDMAAFSYIQETDVEGLYYMFAGSKVENARELLGGIPFEAFISSVKEQYDYVFLLMPALSQSVESTIVSRVVDGSIIIMTSGVSFKTINQPIEMLKKGSSLIGSIMIKKKKNFQSLLEMSKKRKKSHKKRR